MSEYFSLSDCDVIGFDLDHTLCRYHLKETSRLIYESFARFLVEHKGYDKDLLNLTPATWDFCFKGLVVDLEDGNLVKLADDGTVLRYTAFGLLSHTYCFSVMFLFFENMLFFS